MHTLSRNICCLLDGGYSSQMRDGFEENSNLLGEKMTVTNHNSEVRRFRPEKFYHAPSLFWITRSTHTY